MSSQIEAELNKATSVKKRKKGEKQDEYRARLARAAVELKDTDWTQLDDDTQLWVNEAVTALNESRETPGFPDDEKIDEDVEAEDEDADEAEDEDADEDADEKPKPKAKAKDKPKAKDEKPKAKAKAEAKDEKPKAKAKDKPKAKAKDKPLAATNQLRDIMCAHQNWGKDKLSEHLSEQGIKMSDATLSTTFHSMKAALDSCRRCGLLKD